MRKLIVFVLRVASAFLGLLADFIEDHDRDDDKDGGKR